MTQYLLSVWGNEADMAAIEPATMQQMFADVDAVNQKMMASGAWVFAGGLHPVSTATVVREQNGEILTTDGPYVEAREHLGGFWILELPDLDAALAWAREATVACRGPVEVRPFQDDPSLDGANENAKAASM
ncbi:MAG: YciI family protein [Dehalococcoidia bacterium]